MSNGSPDERIYVHLLDKAFLSFSSEEIVRDQLLKELRPLVSEPEYLAALGAALGIKPELPNQVQVKFMDETTKWCVD